MNANKSRADALTGIAQFLTDVVTASGLLSYGRTDKKLATRIGEQADELRKHIHLLVASPVEQPAAAPSGYAYRYPYMGGTVIRFNNGGEVNGSHPIEAMPYWFGAPPASVAAIRDAALEEAAAVIADHQRKGREWIPTSLWGTLTTEAANRIRALKSAATNHPQDGKGGAA